MILLIAFDLFPLIPQSLTPVRAVLLTQHYYNPASGQSTMKYWSKRRGMYSEILAKQYT